MKIPESAENYLETIFVLSKEISGVRSVDIATALGFSKPSVSNAMKSFRTQGYITVDSHGHIHLTNLGLDIALKVYERHELLTQYFMLLGVSEATAKEDACRMEHILSDETFDKLKTHYFSHKKSVQEN
ncbi:MAG: metal-dependent transcriptional regulator [Cellulosilyticaceae bacterium]